MKQLCLLLLVPTFPTHEPLKWLLNIAVNQLVEMTQIKIICDERFFWTLGFFKTMNIQFLKDT